MSTILTSGLTSTINPIHFISAMRRVIYATQRAGHIRWRARLTPGERHIDRICREVAGKPDAALRLFVAAGCVAPVLDAEIGRSS